MANGLFCSESLPSTPKLRHVSNDSNSENTPPELLNVVGKTCDLICTEVLDEREILRDKPSINQQPVKPVMENYNHTPVQSKIDFYLLNDDRVLQNLLRNEERYMPSNQDYFKFVQLEIKPHMREIVVDWMFEVCYSAVPNEPEVFTLAVNFLDRFLSVLSIKKTQFQLAGAACLFLASKFKANQHISSEVLVEYSDYSITHTELKEWELLILQKLRWELSSTTAMDYLHHVIPRLFLPPAVDVERLKQMTNTVISFALHDYAFTYKPPSVLAASAILYSLQECVAQSIYTEQQLAAAEKITKEARTCLQILTHAGGEDLDLCCRLLANNPKIMSLVQHLPHHPSTPNKQPEDTSPSKNKSPDSTVIIPEIDQLTTSTPARPTTPPHLTYSLDLFTSEVSSTSSYLTHHDPNITSAVDVFSDFNSSVLEAALSPSDAYNSKRVSAAL